MAKREYVQPANSEPEYDEQTRMFINSAKSMMAKNHDLAIDRDPAVIMRENNAKLHQAAMAMQAKQGMVKQRVPKGSRVVKFATTTAPTAVQNVRQPPAAVSYDDAEVEQRQPVLTNVPRNVINDQAMKKQGYDSYMQSMMAAPDADEDDMVELSDAVNSAESLETVEEPIQPTVPKQVPQRPKVYGMGEFANNRFPKYESQAQQPEPQPEPQLEPQPEQQEVIETPRQKTADSPRKSQYSFNNNEVTNFGDIRGLPSEGLLYDEPLFGQALTFMDILMLNNLDSANVTSTINTLFERRLRGGFTDGFDADSILQCDESYLMHWLRASTIDDKLPYVPPNPDKWTPYTCPKCNHVAKTPADYEKLEIRFNNLDFKIKGDLQQIVAKHSANGYYTFYMEDNRRCDVYLRRRFHEDEVNQTLEQYRKEMGKEMPLEMQIILHSAVVVEIEGLETTIEKLNYIGNLNYSAAKKFLEEVEGASLTTDITAKVICPFCKKEVVIPYPFRLDYYISGL